MSCFAPSSTPHLCHCSTTLRPLPPCVIPLRGQIPAHRNQNSCLAVFAEQIPLLAVTTKHLIHRAAGLFGRLAIQCRLTGYKPNAIVEIGSAEVTSIHRPSRRTSFCSVYNSGQKMTSARVSSEVDERQSIERLVPTAAHAEERSKCNPCENLSLCMRIFHVTLMTHSKHGETCCNTLTQTEVEQRHEKRTGETSYK